ncbi:gelsolin-like [Ostrinia furnacalis]|uniref:gelsolin-like n=1 Tax=Ostrinia furnacalis TaxID=93504 RepID=UPI001039BDF5|nr:gelsolin-like [Ostrinia furnacalis]
MEHPAFADAGASPGIEIWGIEAFEPVAVDTKMYGKFFNGDSYIILKTTGTGNSTLTYDAHFWLGSKTTQDKKGAAAILTVTLDDMLSGRAVHHREIQGHESSQFLGYFQPAIRYLEGGSESGFNQVEINAGAEKRLLKLSGCENMRIEEVPAEDTSLTKNHCFILENEHDIFVLMPEGAKATQRRKIISVANNLRDEYHNGRATIEIIDEFSSDEDWDLFFESLGSGSRDSMSDDDTSLTYTREDISAVFLYRVLFGDELDLISLSKPYQQSQLSSSEVYILDTPCSGVYVWLGNDVEAETKKNYNDIVQKYFGMKDYPDWVHVTRVAEGMEVSNFKQYFHNWDSVGDGANSRLSETDFAVYSADADESAAAAKRIGKSAAVRGYMPDHGEGSFTVTRIVDGEKEDLTEEFQSGVSKLYQTETYVFKYQYADEGGDDAFVLYWWIGSQASADDKAAAKELVSELEAEIEGNVDVVKIPQGKETKHFLNIFKGALMILFGGKETEYKPVNSNNSYDDDNIRLFRVEGTEPGVDMRAVQVAEKADVLEDDDVFVLETLEKVFVWSGKESNSEEHEAATEFLSKAVKEKEVVAVEQGDEPDEFWEALGGAPEETRSGWKQVISRRVTTPVTLTAVTVSITGKVQFEELPPDFTQQDLSDDGVYILDAGEELYFWQGKNTPERVKAARENIIKEYIEDDGLDRTVDSAISVVVKQGKEPTVFKKLFPEWDADMWDNQTSYDDMKNEIKAANSK